MIKIAIIGAGMAGLTTAHALGDYAKVTVFEKSKGPGGRLSTRHHESFAFDHGAQFFTSKTDEFTRFIRPFIEKGIITRWQPSIASYTNNHIDERTHWETDQPHYIGVPSMNEIAKQLSQNLSISYDTHINKLERIHHKWHMTDDKKNQSDTYDWIILTAPAPQSAALLPPSVAFYEDVKSYSMTSCYAMMAGFRHITQLSFDAAKNNHSAIKWVCLNHLKPGRNHLPSLLLHTNENWAKQHINDDHSLIVELLSREASSMLGIDFSKADYLRAHRWLYAGTSHTSAQGFFIDNKRSIGACGDWCTEGSVEGAFTSASMLAQQIIKHINQEDDKCTKTS